MRVTPELLEEIRVLYYEEMFSINRISQILDIPETTISYKLNKEFSGARKRSEYKGYKTVRLPIETVRDIRHQYDEFVRDGISSIKAQRFLAFSYEVDRSMIYNIITKKTWKDN